MGLILPDNDKLRALRVRRQLMATYSYLLVWFGAVIGVELGTFEPSTPLLLMLCVAATINIIFFALIRSGFSERFSDPALTIPQLLVGIVMITVFLHYAMELRGAMMAVYYMAMTFGVFALNRRQMLWLSGFIIACYTTLEIIEWWILMPQEKVFAMTFGHWAILTFGLFWFIYVGGHIHNLQARTRSQKVSLQQQQERLESMNRELEKAMQQLNEIAIRDELTGLYNRRHFMERLDQEIARADRHGHPLHLVLVDLDHFKQVNDTWGHQVGDEVLKAFAVTASNVLRRSDLLARYGGEEFVIVFTEIDLEETQQVIDRLLQAVAAQRISSVPNLQVTLSAGLATWRPNESIDTLTIRTDQALYKAKASGRNQLVLATTNITEK